MKSLFPKDFAGQFLVGKTPVNCPGGQAIQLTSLHLSVVDPLPVLPVEDADGRQIGAFLGHPVDYNAGHILRERVRFNAPLGADIDAYVEQHVFGCAGSYIFVLDTGDVRRVYLDACGSLSAVYEPDTGRVAATSPLLVTPEDADKRLRSELHAYLNVDRDGWFPAGMTAHIGVSRLMPNFYVDLDSWQTTRHWPTAQIEQTNDPEGACQVIGDVMTQSITAILSSATASMALTAGNETRMLLACTKEMTDKVTFVTVKAKGTELDLARAEELVARFKLPHQILTERLADENAAQDWRARAGQAFGGPHPYRHPTTEPLQAREIFIGGLGGEIGRGFFWRPTDTADTPLDAGSIAARLGMPIHDEVIAAIETWMPSVEGFNTFQKLDLAYLELRMGCWGFALSYSRTKPKDLHPLIARPIFAAMMSLAPDWRRMENMSNRMIQTVIRQQWPELLTLPISKYGDYRDHAMFLRRVITQPNLVVKRLRKRFG